MHQATDFLAEVEALHVLVAPLGDKDLAQPTLFKGWTVNEILQHLHYFDGLATLSLTDPPGFAEAYGIFDAGLKRGGTMREVTDTALRGLSGGDLVRAWRDGAHATAAAFAKADPRERVTWVGPDMSARSSITARLMETWAHGQAVHDLLQCPRQDTDRIRNIAHMGVQTYSWCFRNRGEIPPEPMPHIVLTAPSGATWEWGEPSVAERISGPATAFCQVVTQTRNIADVGLDVTGPNATRWMARAQCFAGPPENPPAPGTRHG